jgi:hypothetical protein
VDGPCHTLYFGGPVSEPFEIVGMRPHVLTFGKLPSFNELVARVRAVINVRCELRLHRRYDTRGNRPIYVMLPLGFECRSGFTTLPPALP